MEVLGKEFKSRVESLIRGVTVKKAYFLSENCTGNIIRTGNIIGK